MAGRAKENLPGGSLKYLFVYLKVRIFKCSYRVYIYIYSLGRHKVTDALFWAPSQNDLISGWCNISNAARTLFFLSTSQWELANMWEHLQMTIFGHLRDKPSHLFDSNFWSHSFGYIFYMAPIGSPSPKQLIIFWLANVEASQIYPLKLLCTGEQGWEPLGTGGTQVSH